MINHNEAAAKISAAAKILRDAYEWDQHQKKQQATKRHETAQQVQPAAAVKGHGAPLQGVHDNLSIDEWMRRENARNRRKQA